MRKIFIYSFLGLIFSFNSISAQNISSRKTMESMVLANKYFMEKWPDTGKKIVIGGEQPSNSWTRSVYYEGLMALYKLNKDSSSYLNYALRWGNFHKWNLRDGTKTRNAEDQCCAQTYIDLYMLDRYKEERIKPVRACIDSMIADKKTDYWTSIDALQMSMPVFSRLGNIYRDEKYYDTMHELFSYTKLKLYNPEEHLWWRDKDFLPPYKEPGGENCYWSRGNGWVISALVRSLEFLPKNGDYRKEYETILKDMFQTLVPLQRPDGYWNVSLNDSSHFGGKELTGTALFVYGMAWGINEGLISKKEFLPVVEKAWNAILTESLHPNGFLGYVQGTGKEPKDGQPVGYDNIPDTEDFGLGCFLLAGSEMYKLEKSMEPKEKVEKVKKEKVEKVKVEKVPEAKNRKKKNEE